MGIAGLACRDLAFEPPVRVSELGSTAGAIARMGRGCGRSSPSGLGAGIVARAFMGHAAGLAAHEWRPDVGLARPRGPARLRARAARSFVGGTARRACRASRAWVERAAARRAGSIVGRAGRRTRTARGSDRPVVESTRGSCLGSDRRGGSRRPGPRGKRMGAAARGRAALAADRRPVVGGSRRCAAGGAFVDRVGRAGLGHSQERRAGRSGAAAVEPAGGPRMVGPGRCLGRPAIDRCGPGGGRAIRPGATGRGTYSRSRSPRSTTVAAAVV